MNLYRAVGNGMVAFSRLRLRVELEGEPLEPAPATLYVATHRSHLDTPLLCAALYPALRRVPDDLLPWFVARDDLFLSGFFASLAPGRVPLRLDIGRALERVRCLPLRPATRMRVVELVRADPALELDALPNADELRRRARALGEPEPRRAGDVLASGYARELWRLVERSEAPRPEAAWERRLADARRDLDRLLSLMRSGASVLVSPEGTPSKDGAVGPLQRGVGLVVRRGRPRRIVALGIAYDPAGPGRTRGIVRVGAPVPPPAGNVEHELQLLLRRTLPRTRVARLAYEYREGRLAVPPPVPPELLDRLAREYESATSA